MGNVPHKATQVDPEQKRNRVKMQIGQADYGSISAGWASMQANRNAMEDSHAAVNLGEGYYFFAVFDGHGGAATAKRCARYLHEIVKLKLDTTSEDTIKNSLIESFRLLDQLLYLQLQLKNEDFSGSTATCALITPTQVFLINAGDSRSILFQNQRLIQTTKDHGPDDPTEQARIIRAGHKVTKQVHASGQEQFKIDDEIAVSRAFADFDYKDKDSLPYDEQAITCKPDIFVIPRMRESTIILACDGIWDVFENDDLISVVDKIESSGCSTPRDKSQFLVNTAFLRQSMDNLSCMCVQIDYSRKDSSCEDLQENFSKRVMESLGLDGNQAFEEEQVSIEPLVPIDPEDLINDNTFREGRTRTIGGTTLEDAIAIAIQSAKDSRGTASVAAAVAAPVAAPVASVPVSVDQAVETLLSRYGIFRQNHSLDNIPSTEKLREIIAPLKGSQYWPIFVSNIVTKLEDPEHQFKMLSLVTPLNIIQLAQAAAYASSDLPQFLDKVYESFVVGSGPKPHVSVAFGALALMKISDALSTLNMSRDDWYVLEDELLSSDDPRKRLRTSGAFAAVPIRQENLAPIINYGVFTLKVRARPSRAAPVKEEAKSDLDELLRQYESFADARMRAAPAVRRVIAELDRVNDPMWQVVKSFLLYSSLSRQNKLKLLAVLDSSNVNDVAIAMFFAQKSLEKFLDQKFDVMITTPDYLSRVQPFAILGMFDPATDAFVIDVIERDESKNVRDAVDVARLLDEDIQPNFHDVSMIRPIRPAAPVEQAQ